MHIMPITYIKSVENVGHNGFSLSIFSYNRNNSHKLPAKYSSFGSKTGAFMSDQGGICQSKKGENDVSKRVILGSVTLIFLSIWYCNYLGTTQM